MVTNKATGVAAFIPRNTDIKKQSENVSEETLDEELVEKRIIDVHGKMADIFIKGLPGD